MSFYNQSNRNKIKLAVAQLPLNHHTVTLINSINSNDSD